MGRGVTDDPGGIRGLRGLLTGDLAGAIHWDLIDNGLHPDAIGSRWFSWLDFGIFVDHISREKRSATYRAQNPQYEWTLQDQLLAKVASTLTQVRYLLALQTFTDVPEDWVPTIYGPEAQESDHDADATKESDDRARRVAAEIRAEM